MSITRNNEPLALPALATPQELAEYIGTSTKTLSQWRWQNTGPGYVHVGRMIRYPRDLVASWLVANTVEMGA